MASGTRNERAPLFIRLLARRPCCVCVSSLGLALLLLVLLAVGIINGDIEFGIEYSASELEVDGDLHIDGHHTTEDSAIALGQAVARALGDKRGIRRYGDALSPMDECLTRVALDISGRPWLVWRVPFTVPRLGEWDTELIEHWFHSFAQAAGITLHVETLHGTNNHHIVEGAYKGLARALRQAVEIDPRKGDAVPSTKGVL